MTAISTSPQLNKPSPPRLPVGCLCVVMLLLAGGGQFGLPLQAAEPAVQINRSGDLSYRKDALGNRIPDFSHCGYAAGNLPIPEIPARVFVQPVAGDDGKVIQAALDFVATLAEDKNGFRGAVRLAAGEFQVAGQLFMPVSGIVLQGSGAAEGGTRILATGQSRRALIQIVGADHRRLPVGEEAPEVTETYLPVGARAMTVSSTAGMAVGDKVIITRPSTAEWIAKVGGSAPGMGWKPGTRDLQWDRTITEISGNRLTIDAPVTAALDKQTSTATVERYEWPQRLERIGVEDIYLQSSYAVGNAKDEDHAWFGVIMDQVQDAWVRRVEFSHFAGGAVHLGRHTKSVTVEDCVCRAPISELAGYRRHTYFTLGQLALFNRCWSQQGRHDFSTGHCAAGPNAFVQCRASGALGASGPIESWSVGVLYDNVRVSGNDLQLENRWHDPPGTGWAAANCVLWQCRAANLRCYNPPGATNWAIGVWATPAGDGVIESLSDAVDPPSLYQAQLRQRLGDDAAKRIEPILGKSVAATNPTYQEAQRFVEQSAQRARLLIDVIRENMSSAVQQRALTERFVAPFKQFSLDDVPTDPRKANEEPAPLDMQFSVENGWLSVDGQLKTGRRLTPSWWRGTLRPDEAAVFGFNVSRFAPGRSGLGLTNDVDQMADHLANRGYAVYEHHYGLWYDRRRDDHLMVRRADGAAAPPFYEQPFARSGQGTAWDGLSKYDLTKENPWYWNRLRALAKAGSEKGFLLTHQHYFQHNILEAGAHWADSPWRPANNVNTLELPEPPPYIGDKRLFMGHHFYDVSKPQLRKLHRRYIRQCLAALADCGNVVQMTSAEYTGPLEFTQFWIDTILEWEREQRTNVLLALSCTRDVQDAILADPQRASHIDIIDIRYWTYDRDGNLYAPPGGKNLAPRQHMRQLKPEPSSFASIAKAVSETRSRFPQKAVLYNADTSCRSGNDGWAVLMGGGSMPELTLPEPLARRIPKMLPHHELVNSDGSWCLATADEYLVYSQSTEQPLQLRLPAERASYQIRWIDTSTNKIVATEEASASSTLSLTPKTHALWITGL